MKKRYEDGEQVQGTPEEIAEYDRLRRGKKDEGVQQDPTGKKPGVLKGMGLLSPEEVERLTEALRERVGEAVRDQIPWWTRLGQPVVMPQVQTYPCPICGMYNCNQTHIFWGTQTAIVSGNTFTVNGVQGPLPPGMDVWSSDADAVS